MKEKDNYSILDVRQPGNDKNINIRVSPLYSVGEDFYSMYQDENNIDIKNNKAQ
ncbi:MAG TPA: hypothetical protein VGK38_14205 [Prolixibacteraceae bacterium]|jgi:hypothetical protein